MARKDAIGYAKDGGGLTQGRLKEVLDYDPLTGKFIWKEKLAHRVVVGTEAGTVAQHGYRLIRIDCRAHYAHRLAWLWVYGEWGGELDHINRDRSDNRIDNLRSSTKPQNILNAIRKPGKSGYKGVWPNACGTWSAIASLNGKRTYLGRFETAEAAARAHDAAKIKHCGEFAILNFPLEGNKDE